MSVLAHKWVSSGALQGQAAFAKARVVVSLHGIMGQGRNWMTAARQLVKRQPNHKVLLIDLRGHGANATICVEINQCVGCTKSFLGDDAAVLAPSSGEEPASPRHRAGVASMAWRTTRRFSTNAP